MERSRGWALRAGGALCGGLSSLRLVPLENAACSLDVDFDSVDDHLVVSGVVRDVVHVFDGMAVAAQLVNDEIDVYHMAG